MAFAYGYTLRRWRDRCGARERRVGTGLYWVGMVALLVLMSVDAWRYSSAAVEDRKAAKWAAHMLLTIVWAVYAVGLLVVGLWKRLRPVRLTSLGLFILSALKLGFADLWRLGGIYRVVSLAVTGFLVIGASYLYHRFEKLLEERWAADGEEEAR